MSPIAPDFIIVGTPRSGTTLVQRLASGIPGVVVPPETHFFSEYYPGLIRRHSFPLDTTSLRAELSNYVAMKTSDGLVLDVDGVIGSLGGSCAGPGELYGAITRSLAGPATLVGEKTPDHLRWWRPLSSAYPDLRVVAVVRDPRGVVASRINAGWGARVPELLAARWRLDQRELARADSALGSERFLQIRYEDAATDPLGVRRALADWLGLEDIGLEDNPINADRLFLPWEHWKLRAAESVTTGRIKAWVDVLEPDRATKVLNMCRKEMLRLGYWSTTEETAVDTWRRYLMPAGLRLRIARMSFSRVRERRWIGRQVLS